MKINNETLTYKEFIDIAQSEIEFRVGWTEKEKLEYYTHFREYYNDYWNESFKSKLSKEKAVRIFIFEFLKDRNPKDHDYWLIKIDVSDLKPWERLVALYGRAKVQGLGLLNYDPKPMTKEEAEKILSHDTYVDYVKGRLMKIDVGSDIIDTRNYNRDNGDGEAQLAIKEYRVQN